MNSWYMIATKSQRYFHQLIARIARAMSHHEGTGRPKGPRIHRGRRRHRHHWGQNVRARTSAGGRCEALLYAA